jgi:outer membrane immunogenic protein
MVRKLIWAAALVVTGSMSAQAADMAVKAAPPMAPAFNWTGWYLGAGGGFMHGDLSGPGIAFATNTSGSDAFVAVEGGYRYQLPVSIVLGFDVTAPVWAEGVTKLQPGGAGPTTVKPQYIVLPTVQIGYAIGSWLPYFGVGAGVANIKVTTTTFALPGAQVSNTQTASVFDLALGIDYALTQNWIVGARYDHLIVEEKNYTFNTGGGGVAPQVVGATTDGVMGMIKYRF